MGIESKTHGRQKAQIIQKDKKLVSPLPLQKKKDRKRDSEKICVEKIMTTNE